MNFVQVWLLGIVNPYRMFDELKSKPAPLCGFCAVLIRFVATSIITILALYLLGRAPFVSSNLAFLTTENYHSAKIFFLPIFGLVAWLLMSSIAHIVLRLVGKASNFDQVLNIVGMGMLILMPVMWLWDWMMIALNLYQLTTMAVSHTVVQLWEAIIEFVGFKRILGLGTLLAVCIALAINCVFILLGAALVR
jgi:hypothetical protein